MMALMRSNDISGSLADELDPPPLVIGPDGAHLTDNARQIPPPPRLCEAGPCRHYHRFVTQLDAERPIAASVAQGEQHGRLEGDGGPQPFHIVVHHYCYPDVGIETELGAMPVLECNRWDPSADNDLALRLRRDTFSRTEAGQAYERELAAWKAAREAEEAVPAQVDVLVVVVNGNEYAYSAGPTDTLRAVAAGVLSAVYGDALVPNLERWEFADAHGNPITNLDATLHMLGIVDGERLTLSLPTGQGG